MSENIKAQRDKVASDLMKSYDSLVDQLIDRTDRETWEKIKAHRQIAIWKDFMSPDLKEPPCEDV